MLPHIIPSVLELTYTAWDLRAFADGDRDAQKLLEAWMAGRGPLRKGFRALLVIDDLRIDATAAPEARDGEVVLETLSTKSEIHVDVWSGNHPFFTGQQRFIDTEGRVEKFQKRFGTSYRK